MGGQIWPKSHQALWTVCLLFLSFSKAVMSKIDAAEMKEGVTPYQTAH